MKPGCSLISNQAILFDADAKGRVCIGCIDSDGINCEVGTKFIAVFREKQNREQDMHALKQETVKLIVEKQEEIKQELNRSKSM